MKKLFQKLIAKLIKKAIDKSVNDAVTNTSVDVQVPDVEPITIPGDSAKKDKWKFIIQVLISILTALAAALTTNSCMRLY